MPGLLPLGARLRREEDRHISPVVRRGREVARAAGQDDRGVGDAGHVVGIERVQRSL